MSACVWGPVLRGGTREQEAAQVNRPGGTGAVLRERRPKRSFFPIAPPSKNAHMSVDYPLVARLGIMLVDIILAKCAHRCGTPALPFDGRAR